MSEKLTAKLDIGFGSGNPAFAPDYRPLNPWGRRMPPPERAPRPALYQVVVRDRRQGLKERRIGPQWSKEFAEQLCFSISKAIGSGLETDWCDPIVVPVSGESLI